MRIRSNLKGTKGWLYMWERGIRFRYMRNKKEVDRRVKALTFWNTYGLAATRDAYHVSRPTLFRWKKALTDSDGKLNALDPRSTAPIHRRQRIAPFGTETFIIEERTTHPRIGKEKLAVLLKDEKNIQLSDSTVGRIIADLKKRGLVRSYTRISLYGKTGRVIARKEPHRKPKQRVPKDFRPEKAGDLIEIDAIILIQDGTRRYILTAIDRESDFAFAYAYKTLSSTMARDFLGKLLKVAPFVIRRIQTDNGSEFAKHFEDELARLGIPHFHTYPRSPKMNAFIERFNRTIQEEFAYGHRKELATDIEHFNRSLMDWLIWYNTKRPHHSLGLVSPMQYLVSTLSAEESHMLWTSTHPCIN